MCVKIQEGLDLRHYKMEIPLEKQVNVNSTVIIDYEPNHPQLEHFLDEVERIHKSGSSCLFKVKLLHNNMIEGMKTKKLLTKMTHDLNVNEVIRALVLSYSDTDKSLRDLAEMCKKNK